MRDREPPEGYTRFVVGRSRVVCADHLVDTLRAALRDQTLHEFAACQPNARPLVGRGTSYAIRLPGIGDRVVVRHNRHGGLLAPITGDLFLQPTRAPLELEIAMRLASSGVRTPRVLAYVAYPAGRLFARADVMTQEIENSEDLSDALVSSDANKRGQALRSTAILIAQLADAGARHHDLNIKNVLLQTHSPRAVPLAFVLDVDRVTFGLERNAAREENLMRLLRSARKWQAVRNVSVTSAELDAFASTVRAQ